LADLAYIFQVVWQARRNLTTAKGFVRRIRERCKRIGDAPHGGRPRDDLEPGLRTMSVERSAAITYRVEPDRVQITNVFYSGQDFEALYRGHEPDDERQVEAGRDHSLPLQPSFTITPAS
jgi:toxin ParE1/3/4